MERWRAQMRLISKLLHRGLPVFYFIALVLFMILGLVLMETKIGELTST